MGKRSPSTKISRHCKKIECQDDGKIIQKFQQIGVAYAMDSSQEMHKTMFNVLYLSFKHEPGWARALEQQYVQEENLAYIPDEETMENKKGFFEVYMME